jgi:hypothetical protein
MSAVTWRARRVAGEARGGRGMGRGRC